MTAIRNFRLMTFLGSNKGYDGCGYFIIGVLLGPVGLLLAILNPNKKNIQTSKSKRCQYCGFIGETGNHFCPACGLDRKGFPKEHYIRLTQDENYRTKYKEKEEEEQKEKESKLRAERNSAIKTTLVVILAIFLLAILSFFLSRVNVSQMLDKVTTAERISKANTNNSFSYEWLNDNFDNRKITDRFTILYSDLQKFRMNEEFVDSGFYHHVYNIWLKKVIEIEFSKNREFLLRRGVDISKLKRLGQKYVKSRGNDNSITKAISLVFDEVIEADFPIVDPKLIAEPIKQKKQEQTTAKSVKESKVSSYSNCYAQFSIYGTTTKTTNDMTLMISNVKPGVYNVLFWIVDSENYDFNYRYKYKIGSTYYYECSNCGTGETSRLTTQTKLSDFIKGNGGRLKITTTDLLGTIITTIYTN